MQVSGIASGHASWLLRAAEEPSRPAPEPVDELARRVQEGGARLLKPKWYRFLVSEPNKPLTPEKFARELEKGRDNLKVQPADSQAALPLRSREDLREVAVFQGKLPVSELSHADQAGAMQKLAAAGWRFHCSKLGEVGLYGAYNAMTEPDDELGQASAVKDGVGVWLSGNRPQQLADFYLNDPPSFLRRLEEEGWQYFDSSGTRVTAFDAPGGSIGKGGARWMPLGDLPLEQEEAAREQLSRFEDLAAVSSPDMVGQLYAYLREHPGEKLEERVKGFTAQLRSGGKAAGLMVLAAARLGLYGSETILSVARTTLQDYQSGSAPGVLAALRVLPEAKVLSERAAAWTAAAGRSEELILAGLLTRPEAGDSAQDETELALQAMESLEQGNRHYSRHLEQAKLEQCVLQRLAARNAPVECLARVGVHSTAVASTDQAVEALSGRPETRDRVELVKKWGAPLKDFSRQALYRAYLLQPGGADTPEFRGQLACAFLERMRESSDYYRLGEAKTVAMQALADLEAVGADAATLAAVGVAALEAEPRARALDILAARADTGAVAGVVKGLAGEMQRPEPLLQAYLEQPGRGKTPGELSELVADALRRCQEQPNAYYWTEDCRKLGLAALNLLEERKADAASLARVGSGSPALEVKTRALELLATRPESQAHAQLGQNWCAAVTEGSRVEVAETFLHDLHPAAGASDQAELAFSALTRVNAKKYYSLRIQDLTGLESTILEGLHSANASAAQIAAVGAQASVLANKARAVELLAGHPESKAAAGLATRWGALLSESSRSDLLQVFLEAPTLSDSAEDRSQAAVRIQRQLQDRHYYSAQRDDLLKLEACVLEELQSLNAAPDAIARVGARSRNLATQLRAVELLATRPGSAATAAMAARWTDGLSETARPHVLETLLKDPLAGDGAEQRARLGPLAASRIREAAYYSGQPADLERLERVLLDEVEQSGGAADQLARLAHDSRLLPTKERALEQLAARPETAPAAALARDWGALTSDFGRGEVYNCFLKDPAGPLDAEDLAQRGTDLLQRLRAKAHYYQRGTDLENLETKLATTVATGLSGSGLARLALRLETPQAQDQVLGAMEQRPETSATASLARKWSAGLSQNARKIVLTTLFEHPCGGQSALDQAALAREALRRLAATEHRYERQRDISTLTIATLDHHLEGTLSQQLAQGQKLMQGMDWNSQRALVAGVLRRIAAQTRVESLKRAIEAHLTRLEDPQTQIRDLWGNLPQFIKDADETERLAGRQSSTLIKEQAEAVQIGSVRVKRREPAGTAEEEARAEA